MTHKTYVEIYNLITDAIGHYETKMEDHLRQLDSTDTTNAGELPFITHQVERIQKCRLKIDEYQTLLERFEVEVDENSTREVEE